MDTSLTSKHSFSLVLPILAGTALLGLVPGGALVAFPIAVAWCGHETVLAAKGNPDWIGTADLAQHPRETLGIWGRSLPPGLVYLSPVLLYNFLLEAARLAPSEAILLTATRVVVLPAFFLGVVLGAQVPAAVSIAAVDHDVLGSFLPLRVTARMGSTMAATALVAVSPFIFIAGLAIQRSVLSDRFDGVVFFPILAGLSAVCGRLAGNGIRRGRQG
jgi:hypothetical protein